MRALASVVLLLALVGCDGLEDGLAPLEDVLVVDLESDAAPVVRLTTEGTPGCATPIAYRTRAKLGVLTVEVGGLEVETGPTCRALIPSSLAVALPPGARALEVRLRGARDRYGVRNTQDGLVLVPIRTTVTRPGPR